MKRRVFVGKSIGFASLTSGCINFDPTKPSIKIVDPVENKEVDRNFTVSVDVSNFEIVDPTVSQNNENAGYILIS